MQLAGSPPLLPKGAVVALPRPLPIDMMLMHHQHQQQNNSSTTSPPSRMMVSPPNSNNALMTTKLSPSTSASSSSTSSSLLMIPITERERIYLKCRVCLCDIHEHNNPNVNIFSRDFLDEKIRRYLYVNVSLASMLF